MQRIHSSFSIVNLWTFRGAPYSPVDLSWLQVPRILGVSCLGQASAFQSHRTFHKLVIDFSPSFNGHFHHYFYFLSVLVEWRTLRPRPAWGFSQPLIQNVFSWHFNFKVYYSVQFGITCLHMLIESYLAWMVKCQSLRSFRTNPTTLLILWQRCHCM